MNTQNPTSPDAPDTLTAEPISTSALAFEMEAPAPVEAPEVARVVYPGGVILTPDEAEQHDAQEATLAPAMLFDDEGAESGFLTLKNEGFRDETIWFGQLSDALTDCVEEMPLTLSKMAGITVKMGAEFDATLADLDFEKQLEIKRFLNDLYRRVRLEDGIVRRWTLQSRAGGVRPITAETIEKLPVAVRQALSQAIIDAATSGRAEHEFFL